MHHRQEFVIVREALLIQLAPTDDAFPIDDKHRALAHAAVFAPHTELLRDRAFRMEIGQQGIGKATELLGPSLMCSQTVYTDAQNLSVRRPKARIVALKGVDLGSSAAGKVKHMEG